MRAIKGILVGATASSISSFILLGSALAMPVQAAPEAFDIGPQSLASALDAFARQSHEQLLFAPDVVAHKYSFGVRGTMEPVAALQVLLKDSGLTYSATPGGAILVGSPGNARAQSSDLPDREDNKGGGKGSSQSFRVAQVDQAAAGNALDSPGNRGSAQSATVEEVVVTAQKREERLLDVPISIAALSGAELQESRIDNFSNLSLAIPGLSVADSGPNYRMVFIRGVANGDPFGNTPLVGTYIDEVPVTGFGGGAIDLRTYDLARVEVLRGPQGTLYGDGSMGGTIRFITNSPSLAQFSGSGDVALSFTQHGAPGQDVIGVINAPIGDTLAVRIAGEADHEGGWIDQPDANAKDINYQNMTDVRAKVLWKPSDALRVNALVNIHRNSAGSPNYGDDPGETYSQTLGRTTVPRIDDDFDIYNLLVTYDFNSFEIINSASYDKSRKQLYDVGNTIPLSPPPDATDQLLFNWSYLSQQRSDELRASSTGAGPWQWTIGVYFRNGEFDIVGPYQLELVSAGQTLDIGYDKEMSTKSWSYFGQTSYKLFDRVEVGVGARYFTDDQGLFNGVTRQRATFHSFDPRFYVNLDVTPDTRVYASAAKGFRSGGFNVSPDQPPFSPESIWTYEVGSKAQLLNGRLAADLALFYSRYEDMQAVGIPPPPALPVDYTFNAGTAEIKGVELSLSAQLSDAVSLGLKADFTHTEYTAVSAVSADHAAGDPLDYVPKYNAALWTKYRFNWKGVPGYLRLDYMRQGQSYYRNRTLWPSPLLYVSESSIINVVNLSANWEWTRGTFGVFCDNLTNDSGFLDPFQIEKRAARPRPRTFGLTFGVNF